MSAAVAAWGVEALVASTVLMIAVLALRGPVRRAFGPDVAYALWALPLLRLLLPPVPQAWREAAVAPVRRASETITIYITQPVGNAVAAPVADDLPVAAIVAGVWMLGAALFLAWHALAHRRFCRRLLAAQVRGSEVEGGIHLIESDAASGPLAFGILRRYVAFPRDFVERYDQEERDLALAHELGHHARGDLLANWLALGVLALHWFNPIAWRAFRAFRADQEIANDARVLAGLSAVARHSYACAIVKSAHGGAVSAACHLHTVNDLKGRLKMLTTNKTSRRRLFSGTAAVALLGVAALGVTASGTQAAETVRTKVEKATGVNLAHFAATPPAPPAAPTQADVPDLPDAPEAVEPPETPTPPAPAAPRANARSRDVSTTTTTDDNGKTVRRVKVVTRDRDGKVHIDAWDSLDALKEIPETSSRNCGGDGTKPLVINERQGETRRVILCTNRIRAVAEQNVRLAANSVEIRRHAMRSALASLNVARATIDRNPNMTADQRRAALDGIDQALAEVMANTED